MFRLKSIACALPLSLLTVMPLHADILTDGADLSSAYLYLNQLRQQTDMTELSRNSLLQQAAANHAEYLIQNNTSGHNETEGATGFTGVSVGDRVLAAGYLSRTVSENVSGGNDNYKDSIDNLMSAIYHRFGFLDFGITSVGVGISRVSLLEAGDSTYVYNMGNEGFHLLCQGETDTTSRFIYNPCPNEPEFAVGKEVYEATRDEPFGLNPNVVLWPANNASNIQPVFYEESPDPLPDYSVSGYPVSIQFNPLTYENVVVSDFTIYHDKNNTALDLTRELNESTDPNARFSGLQYALFPLQRLEWNTRYRAELTYSAQLLDSTTETKSLAWEFNTRQLGVPLYTVAQDDEIKVPSGSTFAVYFPPTTSTTSASQLSWSFSSGMTVEPKIVDSSTLQIAVSGEDTQRATFRYNDGRQFSIELDSSAQLANNALADTGDGVDSAGLNASTDGATTDGNTDTTDGSTTDGNTDTTDGSTIDGNPNTACSSASCTYSLEVDEAGFYIMTIELPEGGTEGFWGISVNTTAGSNPGGFNAGAILKENGDVPGFIGFYLSRYESVTLTPYEYLQVAENILVRVKSDDVVLHSEVVQSGSSITTQTLPPGFYVAEILSQENTPRGLSGLGLSATSFAGGINVGGWIDRETSGASAGFGAFYIASPQTVNVNIFFGDTYGSVGSSRLEADLYLQNTADGSRTLKWSSKTN
ncbi:CAP domain-containing protein [Candidatus Albibeggiatoa sp. nov. NOAA]|uniref:CAP domain-containing protein n=1 Tax=Candidatus Albibeggiatoa sp. nov. NOAA TaxID=3162724 RepID=UPI003301BAD7|nr:CAP domain-containing protein [Thiotrichaceae bacterium]